MCWLIAVERCRRLQAALVAGLCAFIMRSGWRLSAQFAKNGMLIELLLDVTHSHRAQLQLETESLCEKVETLQIAHCDEAHFLYQRENPRHSCPFSRRSELHPNPSNFEKGTTATPVLEPKTPKTKLRIALHHSKNYFVL